MPDKTNENTENAAQPAFDWQAVVDRAKEIPEILPRIKLEEGERADVEFLEAQPRIVEFEDPETHEDKSFPVIEVRDLGDGQRKTIAASSVSMQNGLGKLWQLRKTLKGVRATVACETYEHAKYGKTRGYRVTLIEGQTQETPPRAK